MDTMFDFETAIDATETEVAAGLANDPAGEPAPDTATPAPPVEAGLPSPEPKTPAGTTFDPNDPELQQFVQRETQAAIERMVQEAQADEAAAREPAAQVPAPPDPFSDNYDAELAAYVQWQVKQATAEFTPVVQQMQERENQAWTNHQLETLGVPEEPADEVPEGEVSTRDTVLWFAGGLAAAAQAQGASVEGSAVLAHAWKQLQSRDERIGKAAVAAHIAEIEGIANAPTDAAGTTGATPGLIDAEDELALARLLGERRNAA